MGYKRKIAIGMAMAGLMMASGARADTGEPLVTARLADPETHLLAMDGSSLEPSSEQRNAAFLNALAGAAAARRQAVDARCRAMAADIPASGEARLNWEANCRYQRR